MDSPAAFNVLSLFSGYGGLDLGIGLAVPGARTVCFVEREAYAAAVLAARMAEGALASAPVWGDVCTFDGRPWRSVVDCVTGGFPCQDISLAGKGAGIEGERSGLWKEYARIVGEVRPRFVFVENVAALASRGLDVVLADLAALGFDAEWGVFRASDMGAPHRRERLFILARRRVDDANVIDGRESPGGGGTAAGLAGEDRVAHARIDGLERVEPCGSAARATERGRAGHVAHADGADGGCAAGHA